MTSWLTKELKNKIRKEFEPRYKRKLSDEVVCDIVENLTGYIEAILTFKAMCGNEKSVN